MPENLVYENKPYKGHLSYQVEDTQMFFGRARQAEELMAKMLAWPVSLLHAQSGAGKTSLLNALVIPGLEKRGWTVVLARPHLNPTASLRNAALQQIFPPPATEAQSLDRVLRVLFQAREQVALQEILDHFDLLEPRDDRRRALLQPVKDSRPNWKEPARPLFFRLLRASMEVHQYGEHLQALFDPPEAVRPPDVLLDSRVNAGALLEFLLQPRLADSHASLVGGLALTGSTLRAFVEQLLSRYGRRRRDFGLVLIMDQFEELFTRFTADPGACSDPAASRAPSWKQRLDFFQELEELYSAMDGLPIHLVFSMRDEFIAQLDPLRRFVRELDAATYHLTFLEKEDLSDCVSKPARLFGYDYDGEVYADLFGALVREDRFIEPSQLQIVCDKLWVASGRNLARTSQPLSTDPMLIGMAALPKGGARQILDTYFAEYLEELDAADPGGLYRIEALEILDALVVAETGTRNIVERRVMENAPFHDPRRTALVLESLASKRIVRLEPRLGGEFAEISHEFLIPSIRQRIAAELNGNNEYANFRWALRAMLRFKEITGTENLLSRVVFNILHRGRQRLFLGSSPEETMVPELMLRSAMWLGADGEVLEYWLNMVGKQDFCPTLVEILSQKRMEDPSRHLLALWELDILNEHSMSDALSPEGNAFVLRSQLEHATDFEREAIVSWTKKVKGDEPEAVSDH